MSKEICIIIIIIITLLLNYVMVKQEDKYNKTIQEIKEEQEINEIINTYVDVPDVFKQYYIENNYGSLSQVTEGLFDDPNLLLVNA